MVWNKGIKCPQISAALKGKKLSEEHKEKLSKIHKENWKTGKEKLNSGNFKVGQNAKEKSIES